MQRKPPRDTIEALRENSKREKRINLVKAMRDYAISRGLSAEEAEEMFPFNQEETQ